MPTDEETAQIRKDGFLRGFDSAISAVEREILSDATIGACMGNFGWGSRAKDKRTIITMRAVIRELVRIAAEKARK